MLKDDAAPNTSTLASDTSTTVPRLHPAPGRCIVRIVPRLGLSSDSELKTDSGLTVELSGKYENQPMIGELVEIGDPTNEREQGIADWALLQAEAGNLFVFSQYGSGLDYWNPHMKTLLSAGFDFRWLQGFRLFDIGQLSATVEGSGMYGQRITAAKPELVPVQ